MKKEDEYLVYKQATTTKEGTGMGCPQGQLGEQGKSIGSRDRMA